MTAIAHSRVRSRGGFTLLEVLAALTVFLIGVVGILGLFATALGIHRDATQRQIRAQVTEAVRVRIEERLVNSSDGEVDLAPVKDAPVEGKQNVFYSATFAIDETQGVTGGVLATVELYTLDAGKKHGESFTVFARPSADPGVLVRQAKAGASGSTGGLSGLVDPNANQKTGNPGGAPKNPPDKK